MQAISEGNDPTVRDLAAFQNQIQRHQIRVLVYNTQTVTALTEQLKAMAMQNNIPIVGVSETMPLGAQTLQGWHANELQLLMQAIPEGDFRQLNVRTTLAEERSASLGATVDSLADFAAVAFEDASIAFGRRTIWSGATFTLKRGEFVGLIGPNGTGKTSLLRCVLGQIPVASGSVRVLGGAPVAAIRPSAMSLSDGR